MTWFLKKWEAYWFKAESCFNLSVMRIFFYGWIVSCFSLTDFERFSDYTPALWEPEPLYAFFGLHPFSSQIIFLIHAVMIFSAVFSALGLFTRISQLFAFLSLFYLLGLFEGFGFHFHIGNVYVFLSFIFMFTRSGDALSIDTWIKKKKKLPVTHTDKYYWWPILLVRLTMCTLVASAGFHKIFIHGFKWVLSENLSFIILCERVMRPFKFTEGFVNNFGIWLGQQKLLCQYMAGFTILFEISFILVFFKPKWAPYFAIAILTFHYVNYLLIGVGLSQFVPAYLFFFDWKAIYQVALEKFKSKKLILHSS